MKLSQFLEQLKNTNIEQLLTKEFVAEVVKEELKKGFNTDWYYRIIMLRNLEILNIYTYSSRVFSGTINPEDTFIYINSWSTAYLPFFYYPFIDRSVDILNAFLSKLGLKLGFWQLYFSVAPATGLKYVTIIMYYGSKNEYLTIEVLNLDTVARNTNLYDIASRVLGDKLRNEEKILTKEEYDEIYKMFISQKLFAGHDFNKAKVILFDYYFNKDSSLKEEVERIAEDYKRILQPYKVCYYRENMEKIDCMSIKS